MGRRRVEIEKILDKEKMQTTFSKRRQGLRKKTDEYARLFDAQTAIITFSVAGNCFAYGNPSVDSVVQRYLSTGDYPDAELKTETETEIDPMEEIKEDINVDRSEFRALFDSEIQNTDLGDLAKLQSGLRDLKAMLEKSLSDIYDNGDLD